MKHTLTPFICNHDGSCDETRRCCIRTEMLLTRADRKRIEALGYSANEYSIWGRNGFHRLRNIDNHCYFYNLETKRCQIYEARPEGCRCYPIVFDLSKNECTVDEDCPSGKTVTPKEIEKACGSIKDLAARLLREGADT